MPAPQPANSRTPSRFLREFLERLDADNEAPLGDVATERDAVILMTDMAGSTERIARRGERAALQVMQRHNAILRGCLSETGGVEVQHTGDGIFACFDDTHLAIVCAARMQQAFADEAEAEGDGDPIAVRIGVSAGRVVPVEGRFFGSAVNLAARICAWASPGRIVVSGDVRERGDGAGFSFRDLGPTELKGFSDPMRLHEVVW